MDSNLPKNEPILFPQKEPPPPPSFWAISGWVATVIGVFMPVLNALSAPPSQRLQSWTFAGEVAALFLLGSIGVYMFCNRRSLKARKPRASQSSRKETLPVSLDLLPATTTSDREEFHLHPVGCTISAVLMLLAFVFFAWATTQHVIWLGILAGICVFVAILIAGASGVPAGNPNQPFPYI